MESNGRISIISSNGSSTTSDLFQQDFSGKELLLLLRLQSDPELFESWKANVISGDSDEYYSLAVSMAVWLPHMLKRRAFSHHSHSMNKCQDTSDPRHFGTIILVPGVAERVID